MRLSPTRPQEVIDFEELLSELITMARMLRPHLGSRLVSAMLTYGVRWRTLSREERCGRMNANPVKSTCTSTIPLLSERAGGDACLKSLHSKIDPSKLAAGVMLQARRLCHWRRETACSPESTAGSSEARFNGSPFCVSTERRGS